MSRIVRHWKQVFTPAGPFIFTRGTQLEEGLALIGSDVPSYLSDHGHRMKIWWNAGRIALKNWNYDEGREMTPDEIITMKADEAPPYVDRGGAWFLFKDGTKVHGKKALAAKLAELAV